MISPTYYSLHPDSFGESSPDFPTFLEEHPECFPDEDDTELRSLYTVRNPYEEDSEWGI
jgi:hypothetical protein